MARWDPLTIKTEQAGHGQDLRDAKRTHLLVVVVMAMATTEVARAHFGDDIDAGLLLCPLRWHTEVYRPTQQSLPSAPRCCMSSTKCEPFGVFCTIIYVSYGVTVTGEMQLPRSEGRRTSWMLHTKLGSS